jgi:hypothetical protein
VVSSESGRGSPNPPSFAYSLVLGNRSVARLFSFQSYKLVLNYLCTCVLAVILLIGSTYQEVLLRLVLFVKNCYALGQPSPFC